MMLSNCSALRGACPRGAVYIGRATPKLQASPLANPYIAESRAPERCVNAVKVPDDAVLERYRRRLTCDVVKGFPALVALKRLHASSRVACWCTEREAVLVGAGRPSPAVPCHGDVIFTVWQALEGLGWKVSTVSFLTDYSGANKAWAELYELAFGEPMVWGQASEAGKCSLPPARERGAA